MSLSVKFSQLVGGGARSQNSKFRAFSSHSSICTYSAITELFSVWVHTMGSIAGTRWGWNKDEGSGSSRSPCSTRKAILTGFIITQGGEANRRRPLSLKRLITHRFQEKGQSCHRGHLYPGRALRRQRGGKRWKKRGRQSEQV